MFENNSLSDQDDAKILEKFSNLLNKYQNHIEEGMNNERRDNLKGSNPERGDSKLNPDNIPTLTESVVLHQSIASSQAIKNSPIRYILDTALQDVGIEMNNLDREALAGALENRLTEPGQSTHSE